MQAEQITIIDNRAKYYARLQQKLAANLCDVPLIKRVIANQLGEKYERQISNRKI